MKFNSDKLAQARSDNEKILEFLQNRDKDFFKYIDEFANKKENKKVSDKSYDLVIYTIGFSPYTTILSLSVLQPKGRIVFIFTKESLSFKKIFMEYLKIAEIKSEVIFRETNSNSDTAEVFNIISEEVKQYPFKKLAVDITGGKKPTIAAGYLAASLYNDLHNIDILYLDFLEYEDDRPKYGTEYLSILLNPNDIFNTIERRALEEMYLSKNFKGARRLSNEIRKRLKRSAKKLSQYKIDNQLDEIERIYYFSKLYELRNDFNYKDIVIQEKYLNADEVHGIKMVSNFLERINSLGNVSSQINDKRIYEEFKGTDEILYMALERYNGALIMRYVDLQSYIIRLLSAIELAGIMLTKGVKRKTIDKINKIEDEKLKKDLHGLRRYRNSLNLNHGFKPTVAPEQRYEVAVLKYIALAFDKREEEIKRIIMDKLRYRNYEEIDF
ncbi:hypothetical protein K8M07_11120 [Schnuerera sp. xch1]|uniref:hypothetical protein n=1 Tax=Schnuerera sp. xch1 TaxID=2874283 RepID=UPI001CBB30CC|nr:hypothetical protein [Schnuerera sp. xch1]MBZ2175788.1 hypothetical protein [Schnuerera sp. xch1]